MIKIGIIGFTGYTGRNIMVEAISRGYSVIGLSRHRPEGNLDKVDVRIGSIEDDAIVAQLFRDADAVVIAVHASADGKPFLINLLPRLLAHAAESGKRLGIMGGSGSLLVAEGGPRLLDSVEYPTKNRTDSSAMCDVLDALRASETKADWFFVSPSHRYGAHAPGVPVGAYRTGGDVLLRASSGVSEISGPDFARAVIDEIETPKHRRQRFTVGAP